MQHLAIKYGLIVAVVVTAAVARGLLYPLLTDHLPFVTFFVAVAFAAWLGGWRTSVLATLLVFHNISDRRKTEARQREVERQIAATLESITDGFMRLDRDWQSVYVNAEAERINRLPRAELLGRCYWELFPATVGTSRCRR